MMIRSVSRCGLRGYVGSAVDRFDPATRGSISRSDARRAQLTHAADLLRSVTRAARSIDIAIVRAERNS